MKTRNLFLILVFFGGGFLSLFAQTNANYFHGYARGKYELMLKWQRNGNEFQGEIYVIEEEEIALDLEGEINKKGLIEGVVKNHKSGRQEGIWKANLIGDTLITGWVRDTYRNTPPDPILLSKTDLPWPPDVIDPAFNGPTGARERTKEAIRDSLMRDSLLKVFEQKLEAEINGPMSEEDAELPVSQIEFAERSFDFGEIKPGEKVKHVYTFTNTGDYDLKVINVKPSCGCTTPNWTRELIPPGEEGFVEIEFDSQGKSGTQLKSVTVTTNTDPKYHILSFKGFVITE